MILSEAFKQLDMLTEETFSIDPDGLEELKDFKEKDEVIETENIIDPKAETEEELEDFYVGKVILDCCVCHSKLYKDAEEVVLSEDETVANADEECPFCYSTDGFKVIGQVSAFEEKGEEIEDEVEEVETIRGNGNLVGESKSIRESIDEKFIIKLDNMNSSRRAFISKNAPTNPDSTLFNDVDSWFTYNKKDAMIFDSYSDAEHFWDEYIVGIPLLADIDDDYTWSMEDCIVKHTDKMESIRESISNLSLDTDDTHMEMTSEDNGKVTITTEPLNNAPEDGEFIAPLEDETKLEIEANSDEEPVGEEEVSTEIEEFDEESFNKLGESYLKRVYDNVQSFKTTSVGATPKKLVVEGLIKFSSGKSKKTSFIFESKTITKSGKVKFIGENKEITPRKNAFVVKGQLKGTKLLSESLTYNYRAKDNKGNSSRLYGTVKVGK